MKIAEAVSLVDEQGIYLFSLLEFTDPSMKPVFINTLLAFHDILKRDNTKVQIQTYQTVLNAAFAVLEVKLPVKWWSFTRHSVCHLGRHLIKHGNFEFNNMLAFERLHQTLHGLSRGHKHMMQSLCNHLNISYTASMYQFRTGGTLLFNLLKMPLPFKLDRTIDIIDHNVISEVEWFTHKKPRNDTLTDADLSLLLTSCYGNAGISDKYRPEIKPLKDLLGKYATACRSHRQKKRNTDYPTLRAWTPAPTVHLTPLQLQLKHVTSSVVVLDTSF